MSGPLLVGVVLVLIALNGFFVAVEYSMMAASRERVEDDLDKDRFGARASVRALGKINVHLAASQLGISVGSLLLGWLIEPVVGEAMGWALGSTELSVSASRALGVLIGLLLVTFVHTVMAEMVPKSIALAAPEVVLRMLMPFHSALVVVARPVVGALSVLARACTRLVRVPPADELDRSHTAIEFEHLLDESAAGGKLLATERDLLSGALSYLRVSVGEVMAALSDLVTVPHSASIAEAEELMASSGHSRLLVVDDSTEVIGFLHAKDLIHLAVDHGNALLPPGTVRVALRVDADELLGDVLSKMRRARRHVAVVLDEGRVVGLVTLEDILEAIVGDIRDESDMDEASVDEPRRAKRGDI